MCLSVYNKRLIVIYLILDIFHIFILSFIFIGAKIQMFLNISSPCGTRSCITYLEINQTLWFKIDLSSLEIFLFLS